jgi:hypothetical protein
MQQQHTCGRNFSFNTRQMKLTGLSFFQMIYHKNDHHFWPKLMVDSFSWRWESVGLSTHTQVQALAFNKNKSEKAFLWTKRSPRECNSNWPMLPFPPSLLSYTAAGKIRKILNFFLLEGCTAKHLAVIFWTCSFDSSISTIYSHYLTLSSRLICNNTTSILLFLCN